MKLVTVEGMPGYVFDMDLDRENTSGPYQNFGTNNRKFPKVILQPIGADGKRGTRLVTAYVEDVKELNTL